MRFEFQMTCNSNDAPSSVWIPTGEGGDGDSFRSDKEKKRRVNKRKSGDRFHIYLQRNSFALSTGRRNFFWLFLSQLLSARGELYLLQDRVELRSFKMIRPDHCAHGWWYTTCPDRPWNCTASTTLHLRLELHTQFLERTTKIFFLVSSRI